MAFTIISPRERIRSDADWSKGETDGTEYKCKGCGNWSHIDRWQCLGFTDEDIPDLWPEFEPVYCGDDAIICPRCELSQPSPGGVPLQAAFDFDDA